jgi:hypothetical protein
LSAKNFAGFIFGEALAKMDYFQGELFSADLKVLMFHGRTILHFKLFILQWNMPRAS